MKFEDVLPEMRKGRRARPTNFGNCNWITLGDLHQFSDAIVINEWELEPLPKPRMLAWMYKSSDSTGECGSLSFYPEDNLPKGSRWFRAPWLDEPEVK